MSKEPVPFDQYRDSVGQELGCSRWFDLTQERIDAFADVTDDHQFIHVDPEKAAATAFGGTIAHGFLTLSMLSAMSYDAMAPLEGLKMGINYGFNSVRFLAPVLSGKRVRGRFTLKEVTKRGERQWQSVIAAVIEIEGIDRPAVAAEWVTLMSF